MTKQQLRLGRWVGLAVAIALVGYVISLGVSASNLLRPELRASGEPDTAEVAIRVSNFFNHERATGAMCNQPSPGHWTCLVHLADGRKGTARVVWYGRAQKLGVTLDSAGFERPSESL